MTETETRAEFWARAQADPEALTEAELEQIRADFDELARAAQVSMEMLARAIDPIFEAFTAAIFQTTSALKQLYKQMPTRRQMRRYRKAEQIAAHRDRVAARVPQWKRAHT